MPLKAKFNFAGKLCSHPAAAGWEQAKADSQIIFSLTEIIQESIFGFVQQRHEEMDYFG
jgi:hypothetical protein